MININREEDKTIIKDHWTNSATDVECIIEKKGDGNSSSFFSLKIKDGQVENCNFEMYGEWEREDFLNLLKNIVYEIELLDKN